MRVYLRLTEPDSDQLELCDPVRSMFRRSKLAFASSVKDKAKSEQRRPCLCLIPRVVRVRLVFLEVWW